MGGILVDKEGEESSGGGRGKLGPEGSVGKPTCMFEITLFPGGWMGEGCKKGTGPPLRRSSLSGIAMTSDRKSVV